MMMLGATILLLRLPRNAADVADGDAAAAAHDAEDAADGGDPFLSEQLIQKEEFTRAGQMRKTAW